MTKRAAHLRQLLDHLAGAADLLLQVLLLGEHVAVLLLAFVKVALQGLALGVALVILSEPPVAHLLG